MQEIKNSVLNFINKQVPKIPSMGFSDSHYHNSQMETLSVNSTTVPAADRPSDQDILESIEPPYLSSDENYDICRFELMKLNDCLDCDQIQQSFKNFKQQHQVVSKKVLQLILEHQHLCSEEFEHVLEILEKVKSILELCRSSRKHLNIAKKEISACLGVLANYRKRKLAQNLLNSLKMIKNLHTFDKRLINLLNSGDYVGAILELKQSQKTAAKYKHFSCVASLTNKIQETIETTDSHLDRVLSQMCFKFDNDTFSKLHVAYGLLEKSQTSMLDNLHVQYITAIYNSSLSVVHSYVNKNDQTQDGTDNSGKNPYAVLCQAVPEEKFIPCLAHLCRVLFKIILSYHQLVKWYTKQDDNTSNESGTVFEDREKLQKIWDDVQRKVSTLLVNADLTGYKFEQFVKVLSVVHRLIQIGEEFCNSRCEDLHESIRRQSVNYLNSYHAQTMEELKIFLENETWKMCPVKSTFTITQLQEFKSLRSELKNYKLRPINSPTIPLYSANTSECCSSSHSQDGSGFTGNYFIRFSEDGNPFDVELDETLVDEDILDYGDNTCGCFSDESDEESEDVKKDFVEEFADEDIMRRTVQKKEKYQDKLPILTNTTLSVLRQMGKYLQMSRLLKSIAYQIIVCMNQLYDYYLYAVYSFFTSDLSVSSPHFYTVELSTTLKRISDNLIIEYEPMETDVPSEGKFVKPVICHVLNFTKAEDLHGLSERIVGVESLVFLSKQYVFLQDYLEYLIPPANKILLQQFFEQNIASAVNLRKPVYMSSAARCIDLRQILISMSKVNWEVKDVMSQHNTYVDLLLRELQIFTLRLEEIATKIPLSSYVHKSVWENIAHIVTHTLVQGFSGAKKCSNGGRALMQLDFTQFLLKFEIMSSLRPVPHKEYVENYIKAYYLPEYELESWIKKHREYSSEHLFGLVSSTCQNKKTKQRLLQMIEDNEKNVVVDR